MWTTWWLLGLTLWATNFPPLRVVSIAETWLESVPSESVSRDGATALCSVSLRRTNGLLRVLCVNLPRTPEWPFYMSVHSLSSVLCLKFTLYCSLT